MSLKCLESTVLILQYKCINFLLGAASNAETYFANLPVVLSVVLNQIEIPIVVDIAIFIAKSDIITFVNYNITISAPPQVLRPSLVCSNIPSNFGKYFSFLFNSFFTS
jgi:hypothetical protein